MTDAARRDGRCPQGPVADRPETGALRAGILPVSSEVTVIVAVSRFARARVRVSRRRSGCSGRSRGPTDGGDMESDGVTHRWNRTAVPTVAVLFLLAQAGHFLVFQNPRLAWS